MAPALHAARRDPAAKLRQGDRPGGDAGAGRRLRLTLAVGELALALMLLIGAGLLVRSFIALNNQDAGFTTGRVLSLGLDLPQARYPDDGRVIGFYERLMERLAALPGVESVGAGSSLLLSRLPGSASISIQGRPSLPGDAQDIPVPYDTVTPGFFSTLQIPLRRGRMFTRADSAHSQPVVLVNESFVRRFFPGEDPIGRSLTFGNPAVPETRWQTIVGVVADTKRGGFDREPWAETYFPLRQAPDRRLLVFIRTAGDPVGLAAAAQRAVWAVDPSQAIASVRTVKDMLARADAHRRFTTLLLGVFAAVALLLAAIGVYGVLAHAVGQRTQEIGIRVALGADRRTVLRLILASGVKITAAGLILGIAGALGASHVLSDLLFGISARDPLTFTVVPTLLVVVALAACWIPARRAVRVEPVLALRGE